jgi:hypothetical protein
MGKQMKWETNVSVNAKLHESEPMSNEDKKFCLAQANINVPIEEKSQYEELLCKDYDVFGKDESDLGKATNFGHKIDLKEDSSVYVKQLENV